MELLVRTVNTGVSALLNNPWTATLGPGIAWLGLSRRRSLIGLVATKTRRQPLMPSVRGR